MTGIVRVGRAGERPRRGGGCEGCWCRARWLGVGLCHAGRLFGLRVGAAALERIRVSGSDLGKLLRSRCRRDSGGDEKSPIVTLLPVCGHHGGSGEGDPEPVEAWEASMTARRTPSGVGEEAVAATGRPSSWAAAAVVAPIATSRVTGEGDPSSSRTARVVDGAVSTAASTPPAAQVRVRPWGSSEVSAVTVVFWGVWGRCRRRQARPPQAVAQRRIGQGRGR